MALSRAQIEHVGGCGAERRIVEDAPGRGGMGRRAQPLGESFQLGIIVGGVEAALAAIQARFGMRAVRRK